MVKILIRVFQIIFIVITIQLAFSEPSNLTKFEIICGALSYIPPNLKNNEKHIKFPGLDLNPTPRDIKEALQVIDDNSQAFTEFNDALYPYFENCNTKGMSAVNARKVIDIFYDKAFQLKKALEKKDSSSDLYMKLMQTIIRI